MTIKTKPKNKIYNEIYPPIIEKQKILDANELLVYQLIKLYSETDKGVPCSYRPTPEAHATLFFKKVQSAFRTSKDINWQSRMESNKTVCALCVWARKVQKRFYFDQSAF